MCSVLIGSERGSGGKGEGVNARRNKGEHGERASDRGSTDRNASVNGKKREYFNKVRNHSHGL